MYVQDNRMSGTELYSPGDVNGVLEHSVEVVSGSVLLFV